MFWRGIVIVKEKLEQLILESVEKYNCNYTTSLPVDNIYKEFDKFKGIKQIWIKKLEMALRRVCKDMGRKDYKDIKRVLLPIGTSGKAMIVFYRVKKSRRLIDNFKVMDSASL